MRWIPLTVSIAMHAAWSEANLALLCMYSVSLGVEELRLWCLGVVARCVLNFDKYVWFVL